MSPDAGHKKAWQSRAKFLAAVILLAVAASVAARHLMSSSRKAVTDRDATVKMYCSECQQTFDMPFSEYRRRAPQGTDVSGPIDCPKCGGRGCVVRAGKQESAEPEEEAEAPQDRPPAVFVQ